MGLNRFVPALYYRHRGHFLVAASIALLHMFAAADELLPEVAYRHSQEAWRIHNTIMSPDGWAVFHILAAVCMIVGIYWLGGNLMLIRLGSAFSASFFILLGIGFSSVPEFHDLPILRIGFCVFAVLSSLASLLEPAHSPSPDEWKYRA